MKSLSNTFMTAVCLGLLAGTTFVAQVTAERLESNSYVIQFGNFNVTAGEKNSASYNVTDTVGQVGAGPYGQYGSSTYFVGGGFQYIYQIDEFTFSVSKVAIDLGTLTPGVHSSDDHNLNITTRGAGGYTVYAYEIRPLRHINGTDQIPDTTCDAGGCTETSAAIWTDQDIAGFGYNMTGDDIPADFIDISYFRPFPDDSLGETMQAVMSSSNIADNREATITYQAGISGDQDSGRYETGIAFVAVPGY